MTKGSTAQRICEKYNRHETHTYHPPSCECCRDIDAALEEFGKQEYERGVADGTKAASGS